MPPGTQIQSMVQCTECRAPLAGQMSGKGEEYHACEDATAYYPLSLVLPASVPRLCQWTLLCRWENPTIQPLPWGPLVCLAQKAVLPLLPVLGLSLRFTRRLTPDARLCLCLPLLAARRQRIRNSRRRSHALRLLQPTT